MKSLLPQKEVLGAYVGSKGRQHTVLQSLSFISSTNHSNLIGGKFKILSFRVCVKYLGVVFFNIKFVKRFNVDLSQPFLN